MQSPQNDHRERLISEELSTVRFIARKVKERLPKHIELDDLIQAGTVGLIDAAGKFDPSKRVSFKSYAQFRIRGAILDSLRDSDWGPRDLRRKARYIETVVRQLWTTLGRNPQEEEIAQAMGVELQDLQQTLWQLRSLELGSIALSQEEEDSSDRVLALAAGDELNPFHICARTEQREKLAQAINMLGEREQLVLSLYYFEELSMKEIGRVLGVVESRVSQIHTAAIIKLRALLGGGE